MERIVGRIPVDVVEKDATITMTFKDGSVAEWLHYQDCCENVVVEDVNGIWSDLYGHPLLVAEERISDKHDVEARDCYDESNTWTFYTFRSNGGTVVVRWHGSSNGYYSESVTFELTE